MYMITFYTCLYNHSDAAQNMDSAIEIDELPILDIPNNQSRLTPTKNLLFSVIPTRQNVSILTFETTL